MSARTARRPERDTNAFDADRMDAMAIARQTRHGAEPPDGGGVPAIGQRVTAMGEAALPSSMPGRSVSGLQGEV